MKVTLLVGRERPDSKVIVLQRRDMQLEDFEAVSDNPQAKLSAVINKTDRLQPGCIEQNISPLNNTLASSKLA